MTNRQDLNALLKKLKCMEEDLMGNALKIIKVLEDTRLIVFNFRKWLINDFFTHKKR